MKYYFRLDFDTGMVEKFFNSGIWSDGRLAYSKITINDNGDEEVKECDNGTYYQVRLNGKLTMIRV